MSWHVRRAGPHDLDDIMWLEQTSFPTDAWSRAQMRGELHSPYGWYLVAETTDESAPPSVIGYAGFSSLPGGHQGDVQTIAVAEHSRRQGIGRVLFRALLDEAARRDVHDVFLEVRADNPTAQAMYASFGFEQIGTRPRYYQPDDVDAIVMRVHLRPEGAR